MPDYQQLANSIGVPFGGVSALQGSYAGQQYNQPQITPQMLAQKLYSVLTRQVPQNSLTGPVDTTMTPELMAKAYGMAEPVLGATSKVASSWNFIKKAIEKIPKYSHGMGDSITNLHKQFPDMSKPEFDEMILNLWRDGKISLHGQDLPKGYKGEMIAVPTKRVGDAGKLEDAMDYYHYFTVKPEWR